VNIYKRRQIVIPWTVGVGILIRDSNGLVAAMESKIMECGDTLQTQAWAVLADIKFAHYIVVQRLEMEVGFQELLSLVKMGSPCLAYWCSC
jgi:hypothetical protein